MKTYEKPLSWLEFRKAVGAALEKAKPKTQHVKDLVEYILDLDYEGPPIAGGRFQSLFNVYEDLYLDEIRYAQERGLQSLADAATEFSQPDMLLELCHDCFMDSHPGLAPDDVCADLRRICGV